MNGARGMNGSELPIVSICIPTYNNAHFLADALDSVFAQTFTSFECIVVDNCSTDNTDEVVAKYLKRDERLKYIVNETNLGSGGNFNRCLHHATGNYVKFLCADDLLKPTCVEELINMMEDDPSIVLASCARQLTDKDLTPTFTLSYSNQHEILTGTEVIKRCFIAGQNLIGEPSAVLIKKKDAARGFNLTYRQLIDLEMWFHLLEKGNFAFTPEVLCIFRQHENQETRSNFANDAGIDDEFRIFNEYVNKEYINIPRIKKLEIKFAKALFTWNQQYYGIDKMIIDAKLSQYFGLPLFHFLLMYKKLKDIIRRLGLLRL